MKFKKNQLVKTTIRIPEIIIENEEKKLPPEYPLLKSTFDLIGNVLIAGNWNEWGKSPKKTTHIIPDINNTMIYLAKEYYYELRVTLPVGMHFFKPVIVLTNPFNDKTCFSHWVNCLPAGVVVRMPDGSKKKYYYHEDKKNWVLIVT